MPQPKNLSDLRDNTAQAQAYVVYLTPTKYPQEKSATGANAQTSFQKNANSTQAPQQLSCLASEGAPNVLDKMSHTADHLCSTSQGPDASGEGGLPQLSSQLSHHQIDASWVFDDMIQSMDQLSLKAKAPAPSVGRSGGLSPKLNPSSPAWSPPLRGQGDIDMSDEFSPLHSAARKEHSQISAHLVVPELSAYQAPAASLVNLPITHDMMCFPGIPETTEDTLPKVHARGRFSNCAAQGSGTAKKLDEMPLSKSPHTSGVGEESTPLQPATTAGPSSPSLGRISFATAIRKKLWASDTRRTERALKESGSPTSESSEEDDPPDPPTASSLDCSSGHSRCWITGSTQGRNFLDLSSFLQDIFLVDI